MAYSLEEIKKIFKSEYFTPEQQNFICMLLIDPKSNSIYLQSVMSADMKRINLTKPKDD